MDALFTDQFLTALIFGAITAGVPLLLAGLGEQISEKAGVLNIGIEGIEPAAIAAELWRRWRIIVVGIGHEACTGIRVTPNVYTTLEEVDTFIEAYLKSRDS